MHDIYKNILALIGNTPLVEIANSNPFRHVRLFGKLESYNPGGSIKDRIALYMIEEAERKGLLTKEKIILEATSGNTGIGLALVARVKGYRVELAMSEAVSTERKKILKALGAGLILTPDHLGTDGAIEEVYRLAREYPDNYYMTDQFNNGANPLAHYKGTAEEIWLQTQGQVTHVVVPLGTTGTAMGVSKRLKEYNKDIRIIGVEPYLGHGIQGLKNMKESYRPGIFEKNRVDEIVNIEDEEAFEMARRLTKKEGLFVGMSSGAAFAAALRKAEVLDKGTMVIILPDGGERYLSTSLFAEKELPSLKVFNSLTRRKEDFIPLREGRVSMYTCGPTVDGLLHLRYWRRFIVADIIKRFLEFKGFRVNHVINITDIDDRTITGSEKAAKGLKEFTDTYIQEFFSDSDVLNIKRANTYPKASEHIQEMIDLAKRLQDKGLAYEMLHCVYFNIAAYREYGKLSRIDLNKIKLGSTVDLDNYAKDNPRDFTLFKRSNLAELKRGIFHKTQWGNVRPGWHIECSAMAMKYLGSTLDIHTSDYDLIFPHHENETAISEGATDKRFVNYWIHNRGLIMDEEGLCNGNDSLITLRDLLKAGYSGRQVRFWLLSTHYRKPVRFNFKLLNSAKSSLARIDDFIHRLTSIGMESNGSSSDVEQYLFDLMHKFVEAMDNDFNTSVGLASIFEFIKRVNPLIDRGRLGHEQVEKIVEKLRRIDDILGILRFDFKGPSAQIQALVRQRDRLRAQKDWVEADRIRDEITRQGYSLIDTPHGTSVVKIPF